MHGVAQMALLVIFWFLFISLIPKLFLREAGSHYSICCGNGASQVELEFNPRLHPFKTYALTDKSHA